jgi:hypothetical protein
MIEILGNDGDDPTAVDDLPHKGNGGSRHHLDYSSISVGAFLSPKIVHALTIIHQRTPRRGPVMAIHARTCLGREAF